MRDLNPFTSAWRLLLFLALAFSAPAALLVGAPSASQHFGYGAPCAAQVSLAVPS